MNHEMKELLNTLLRFRKERDWEQFHTPKNLAISISIEAGELLEHFQWTKGNEEIRPEKREKVTEELADIFIYLILLSNELGVDLIRAARDKIQENERKYSVEKSKGTAKKYREL